MQAWNAVVAEISNPQLVTIAAIAVLLTAVCSLRLALEKGGSTAVGSDGKPSGGLLTYIVTHHRWIVCIFGLLPLCFVYETYVSIMDLWADFMRWFDNKGHDEKVKAVCDQVRAWHSGNRERPMVTARPGWKTMSLRIGLYKKTHTAINLGALVCLFSFIQFVDLCATTSFHLLLPQRVLSFSFERGIQSSFLHRV